MSQAPHEVKCRKSHKHTLVFEECPIDSPHQFKALCIDCGYKFVTWTSMSVLEEIVKDNPNVRIKPLPTSTFDDLFDAD